MKHLLGALSITLLVASAPSAATASAPCRLPAAKTVETDHLAKLLAVPTPQGSALYACIRRTGRKIALDDSFSDARLTGRWVAWQRAGRPGHWRIVVHDLRTGRERLVDGHVAAHSLGLTTRGSIVWADRLDAETRTPLFANELGSGGRLLDGGNVDPTSVRLTGRRVTWFTDDVEHSATLR